MSDGLTAPELERGLELGVSQDPDLICFTGDYVSATRGFDRAGLERLLRRAARTAPTYAVLGNHDGGQWLGRNGGSSSGRTLTGILQSAGIRVLHNRSAAVDDLTLVGVADYWSGEFDARRAFAGIRPSAATVVLCHNPDAKQEIADRQWDLMLSGHTHGGQARIPGINPAWMPVADKRFVSGLYEWNQRQLFITRGLGSPKHVRAFCRPEISILELVSA